MAVRQLPMHCPSCRSDVLLGLPAARAFLGAYGDVDVARLGDVAGREFPCEVGGHLISAWPLHHPSGVPSVAALAAYDTAAESISAALS